MKQQFKLVHEEARRRAIAAIHDAPEGWCVTVAEPTRNLDQNAASWPILQAFSEQLEWPVNGAMTRMSPENWKDVLTAAFKQEQVQIAQGINGGMVMLGQRTSKFKVKEFSEWLEFLHAVAAERGVVIYAEERAA